MSKPHKHWWINLHRLLLIAWLALDAKIVLDFLSGDYSGVEKNILIIPLFTGPIALLVLVALWGVTCVDERCRNL